MTEASKITLEEAARRLSATPDTVLEYVRQGKLETTGEGDSLRIFWPEADPRRELYPNREPALSDTAPANGHATRSGDFPDEKIQPFTNNATDPKWLVPTLMFLWIFLFIAGGIAFYYVVRYTPQLTTTKIG